jgi:uncharacterized protein (TIGR04222 family)
MTESGLFDLSGNALLALCGVIELLALIASLAIPRWLRPEGRTGTVSDIDQLAYLAGGAGRYADAVITRLYVRGAVGVEPRRGLRIRARPSAGTNAAEIAVLGLPSPARYAAIRQELRGKADLVGDRLIETGLLIDDGTALQMRFWQTLPLIAVFLLGVLLWQDGMLREWPGALLAPLLFAVLAAAMLRFAVLDRRTHAGLAVLAEARRRHQRLRLAAPRDEAGMAVALFGTSALVGSSLSDLHHLRASSGSSTGCGGGSCGGDVGSGGCGGGGCGGGD